MLNPGSTCCRLITVRSVRPAPMRSMKDAATCTTISALRTLCRLWVVRPPSRIAGAIVIELLSAGTAPKIRSGGDARC